MCIVVYMEREKRSNLEDAETCMLLLKWLCVNKLFEWATAHSLTTCDILLDFVDSLKFRV